MAALSPHRFVPSLTRSEKRLSEAEAEMPRRIWEQRSSDVAYDETNWELHLANQWADLAQREKLIYDEECVAKETDRARQLRMDELALPTTESRLLTQIQDLQKKGEFIDRRKRIFLGSWDSEQFWSVPRPQPTPLPIPSARTAYCRDSGLPHDPRNTMGTSGNGFESPPAQRRAIRSFLRKIQRIWHHLLADWDKAQRLTIPSPRFSQGIVTFWTLLYHTGGTDSHNGLRFPISELHLGKFPDSNGNSKLESRLRDWIIFWN